MQNYQDLVCYQVIFEPNKIEMQNEHQIAMFNVIYLKFNNPETDKGKSKIKRPKMCSLA